MCGRYVVLTDPEYQELQKIVNEIERNHPDAQLRTGEIFPTNSAPVLFGSNRNILPAAMAWGFPGFHSGTIINARAETAHQKKTFAESLNTRRCAVPSTGFFEWKQEAGKKTKYLFTLPEHKELYMAGFWKEFDGVQKFVILTTAPNESVADIHNRMPLVLPRDEVQSWITDTAAALQLLGETPPMLVKEAV